MSPRNHRTPAKPAQAVKPHSSPQNRIPYSFGQAIDVLLSVDHKKLPTASTKDKKAAKKLAKSKKKA
jgi:hypothetical protein